MEILLKKAVVKVQGKKYSVTVQLLFERNKNKASRPRPAASPKTSSKKS